MGMRDVPERGENLTLGNIGNVCGLNEGFPAFDRPPARFREYRNLSRGMAEADARQSVALSRTAQAKVFAVCVWFTQRSHDRFRRPATPLRPCREDEWFGYWPCCGVASRNG